ncbi:MAG TPA: tetratricopeptide repeat protein [Myxococcota bacterium]|jgi:Flp pilus assembly protein TadD
MRFLRRTCLVAVLLAMGCVTPIEKSRWIRVETEHFELISGAGASDTLAIAQRLELLRAVLQRVGLQTNLTPRVPLLVYVFADADAYARFAPRADFAGFMLPRTHRNFLVVQADAERDAGGAALHEYVHFVLRNGAATRYPAWYDEGLAEFLSTVSMQDDKVLVGTIPAGRERWLRYGNPMSLRQMMTADEVTDGASRSTKRFYAQAWALMHFFHVADRVGFARRRPQLADYVARLNRGEAPDDACREAFGTDFEALDKEFTQYLAKGLLPYLGLSPESLAVSQEFRESPLPEAERSYLLGELALALGDDWRGEAALWFRQAVQVEPGDARAHAALGRVLKDPSEADAHLARALALSANDPEVQRHYAEAMLARATAGGGDAPALIDRARRAFRRSIELDPAQVAAHAGLGRSYAVASEQGDPAEGFSALETARERLPTNHDVALDRARLEVKAGSVERARGVLVRLSPPTHGDPLAASQHAALGEVRVAAGLPAQPEPSSPFRKARIVVETPRDGEKVRGLSGWVVARGQGGLWESALQDVIIAIDVSPSAFLPTGSDLDGDGEIGVAPAVNLLGPGYASTDPDDAVIRAELLAARALIRQLDPVTTRVGILTFADDAKLLAPLGTPDAALAFLDDFEVRTRPSRTSLAAPLDEALDAFFESREGDQRRQRTVLLLSDGQPTTPSKELGKLAALAAADKLGEIGIPVQAFALGRMAIEDPEFFRSLAERSGGEFYPLENPADVVTEMANIRFTALEDVVIESSPIGQAGRAVRVFPNGSFDGYVPLAEGENRITITGVMEGGEKLTTTRTVFFERPSNPSPADELAAQELRDSLQERKVEIELLAEMRRAGPLQMRQLTVEVVDPPKGEPARE